MDVPLLLYADNMAHAQKQCYKDWSIHVQNLSIKIFKQSHQIWTDHGCRRADNKGQSDHAAAELSLLHFQ